MGRWLVLSSDMFRWSEQMKINSTPEPSVVDTVRWKTQLIQRLVPVGVGVGAGVGLSTMVTPIT